MHTGNRVIIFLHSFLIMEATRRIIRHCLHTQKNAGPVITIPPTIMNVPIQTAHPNTFLIFPITISLTYGFWPLQFYGKGDVLHHLSLYI